MVMIYTPDNDAGCEFLLDETSVLAFLADCEMALDENAIPAIVTESTPPPSNSPASWSESSRSANTGKVPEKTVVFAHKKSWRERRKDEVLHLREEVKRLSAQLNQGPRMNNATNAATSELMSETALLWKQIVARKAAERELSEQENAELRAAVKCHVVQAKSLQRALKRRLADDVMKASLELCKRYRLTGKVLMPPTDNAAVFDELSAGMDATFAGLSSFFEALKIDELQCPGRKNNTASSVAQGTVDTYMLPFDFHQADRAIWNLGTDGLEDLTAVFAEDFAAGANTRMKSVGFSFTMGEIDTRIVMRKVGRRYAESDRTVFIWRTLIEPEREGVSMAYRETTCLVLRQGASSQLGATTLMQSHRQVAARDGGCVRDQTWKSHRSVDASVSAWDSSITRFNHRVEDAMLQTTHC